MTEHGSFVLYKSLSRAFEVGSVYVALRLFIAFAAFLRSIVLESRCRNLLHVMLLRITLPCATLLCVVLLCVTLLCVELQCVTLLCMLVLY